MLRKSTWLLHLAVDEAPRTAGDGGIIPILEIAGLVDGQSIAFRGLYGVAQPSPHWEIFGISCELGITT